MEWKNERPEWCPHADCQYRLRAQDAICVGHLPDPLPHGKDQNIYRLCIRTGTAKEDVYDLQVNDSDLYHFRRLFKALPR